MMRYLELLGAAAADLYSIAIKFKRSYTVTFTQGENLNQEIL